MADINELYRLLQSAEQAGDGTTAGLLGREILRMQGAQYTQPTPPPGVMIHSGDGRSYITDGKPFDPQNPPAISAARPDDPSAMDAELGALAMRGRQGADPRSMGALAAPTMQGLSMGWGDELVSAAAAALQPGQFGPNYDRNQAFQRQELEAARNANPFLAPVAEMGGGIATGLAAAPLSAARFMGAAPSLVARVGAGVADGAAMGALYGAGAADAGERLSGAAAGGAMGAALGGAVPLGSKTAAAVGDALGLTPAMSRAGKRVGQLLDRAGTSVNDVRNFLISAKADRQPEVAVTEALGRLGGKEAGRIYRTASQAGEGIADALETRQLGQGPRVATFLDEASSGKPGKTAAMTQAEIIAARDKAADIAYGEARKQAGAVDVSMAKQLADDFLMPGVSRVASPSDRIADDSIEALVRRARSYFTDGNSQLTDFQSVLRAKQEIDAIIERAPNAAKRELIPMKKALDDALASASAPYAGARDAFRLASQDADAIDQGAVMFKSGRPEDNLATFNAMSQGQQQGARVGYGSEAARRVLTMNPVSDATTPLRAPKSAAELKGLFDPRLGRQVDRERQMFLTYKDALGNSKTAERLAEDVAAGAGQGGVLVDAMSGNITGLMRRGAEKGFAMARGERDDVRALLSRLLMGNASDPDAAAMALQQAMASRQGNERRLDPIIRALFLQPANAIAAQ